MVFGEITTRAKVDYEAVVRKTVKEIGFISDDVGLDSDKCKVGAGRAGWEAGSRGAGAVARLQDCLLQAAHPESPSTAAGGGSMPSLWPWSEHLPPPALPATRCWCTWRSSPPTLARVCTAWAPRPWRRLAPATRCARQGSGEGRRTAACQGLDAANRAVRKLCKPSCCSADSTPSRSRGHCHSAPSTAAPPLLCRATCLATPPMRPPSSCP